MVGIKRAVLGVVNSVLYVLSQSCLVKVDLRFTKFKMRLALSVLVFFVAVYSTGAQEQGESYAYNYYPFYGPNARLFITSTTTTTTVSTSTSTVTCTTPYTGNTACARRRGIEYDDEEQQFPIISPSDVQG
jgi:hypothetical protein